MEKEPKGQSSDLQSYGIIAITIVLNCIRKLAHQIMEDDVVFWWLNPRRWEGVCDGNREEVEKMEREGEDIIIFDPFLLFYFLFYFDLFIT